MREAGLAANAENTDASEEMDFGAAVVGTIQLTNVGRAGEIMIRDNLRINGAGRECACDSSCGGTAIVRDRLISEDIDREVLRAL